MAALQVDLDNYADLTTLPAGADLVGELRAWNAHHGAEISCMWLLAVTFAEDAVWGRGPASWLNAGTAGPTGALQWVDPGGVFIPVDGLGRPAEWLPYFNWAGTECGVHVALRVPIEQVFAAVAEVSRTRRRPRCVEWVQINRDNRMIRPAAESLGSCHRN
ncbi:MAG TPA: Imm1 family immunity protein [Pseudonocardiaceae bacterium]|jgi:hypothetical protein|nr:Imm1 family immunity protein [Pseudonocardiaceae bacterium]